MNDAIILSIISSISTLFGSLILFIKPKRVGRVVCFLLSFSMTILLLVSIFELMLESIPNIISYFKNIGIFVVILTFILGYLTIYIINRFIGNNESIYRISIISFIAMFIHNFLEGMIVYMSSLYDTNTGFKICLSMILHNVIEGLIICVLFMLSRLSRRGVVVLSIISSLSEFIGALLSHMFFRNVNSIIILLMILFVAGLMISLALNEILKEILLYNDKKYTLYGILLGILSYIIILLI